MDVSQIFHWPLLIILLLVALRNSFIQDDAFISFRYAHNLVYEHELTWNPKQERVEGYTNFLWTIMMAAPIALGIKPEVASRFFGLLFGFGTFFLTYHLSLLVFNSQLLALLTILLLGTNFTFSAYVTGGLETQLQSFLVVTGTYLAFGIVKYDSFMFLLPITFASLCAIALLTRLDSIIPFVVLYVFVFTAFYEGQTSTTMWIGVVTSLVLPPLAIVGLWLLWKFTYYGDVLPNTYYAKGSHLSLGVLRQGLFYVGTFFHSYFLIPFIILGAIYGENILSVSYLRIVFAIIVLWCTYMIRNGGDFMEFRFFVPVLPLFFVLIVSLIHFLDETILKAAFVSIVLLGSLHHYRTFRFVHGIESISQLNGHVVNKDENWKNVGLVLKEMFSESANTVKIATTAAGAIPYYSRLPTVDMLGLNDKWVARNGPIVSSRPGHQKRATMEYLVKQNVNLVVGHPQVELISAISREEYSIHDLEQFIFFSISEIEANLIPATAKVVEIPLDSDYKITVLYLTQHSYIEELIQDLELNTYEITRATA